MAGQRPRHGGSWAPTVGLRAFSEGTNHGRNTNTLNRIQDIDKLSEKDQELVFEFLDSFISNRKIKKALI